MTFPLRISSQVLFLAVCFALPIYLLQTPTAIFAFITHFYSITTFLAAFFVTFYVAKASENQSTPPTLNESRHARWWLLNGLFVHFLLNGSKLIHRISFFLSKILSSTTITIPEYFLHTLHGQIDTRYVQYTTTSPSYITILMCIELFILMPLCFTMYYAVQTRQPWRAPLQAITSTIQLLGTIIYIGTEFCDGGQEFLPHFQFLDKSFQFTQERLIKFWFPFLSIGIWIIVPSCLMYNAVVELTGLVELNVGNIVAVGPKQFIFSPQAFQQKNHPPITSSGHPASPRLIPNSKYSIQVAPRHGGDYDDDFINSDEACLMNEQSDYHNYQLEQQEQHQYGYTTKHFSPSSTISDHSIGPYSHIAPPPAFDSKPIFDLDFSDDDDDGNYQHGHHSYKNTTQHKMSSRKLPQLPKSLSKSSSHASKLSKSSSTRVQDSQSPPPSTSRRRSTTRIQRKTHQDDIDSSDQEPTPKPRGRSNRR